MVDRSYPDSLPSPGEESRRVRAKRTQSPRDGQSILPRAHSHDDLFLHLDFSSGNQTGAAEYYNNNKAVFLVLGAPQKATKKNTEKSRPGNLPFRSKIRGLATSRRHELHRLQILRAIWCLVPSELSRGQFL